MYNTQYTHQQCLQFVSHKVEKIFSRPEKARCSKGQEGPVYTTVSMVPLWFIKKVK